MRASRSSTLRLLCWLDSVEAEDVGMTICGTAVACEAAEADRPGEWAWWSGGGAKSDDEVCWLCCLADVSDAWLDHVVLPLPSALSSARHSSEDDATRCRWPWPWSRSSSEKVRSSGRTGGPLEFSEAADEVEAPDECW